MHPLRKSRAPESLVALLGLMVPALSIADDGPAGPSEIAVAELSRATPVDFAREIAPIFRANCVACHNEEDPEADLVLETPATILRGGTRGPAVVPGESSQSLLLRVASHRGRPAMPPRENKVAANPLTPEQLGLIRLWIDQGAKGSPEARPSPNNWQAPAAGFRPILALAIAPDAKDIACSRADQVFLYDLPAERLVARLVDPELSNAFGIPSTGRAHVDLVRSLAFSRRGDLLASGGFRTIKVWRRPRTTRLAAFTLDAGASAVAVDPAGRLAAFAMAGGRILIVELPAGRRVRELAGREMAPVRGLVFSPDGRRLYDASTDGTIRIWDVEDGSQVGAFATPSAIHALAILDAGGRLLTGHQDGLLRLWEGAGGSPKPFAEIKAHSGPITGLATWASASGEVLSAGEDGRLRRWDVATSKLLREFSHGGPIAAIAARPDGTRFASVGGRVARLWDAAKGDLVAECKGDQRALDRVRLAEGEIAFANGDVDVRKQELREAESKVEGLTRALEASKKPVEQAEKALAEKREAARKPAAEKAAAESAAVAAAEALTRANAARQAAEKALARARDDVGPARDEARRAREAAARGPNDADLGKAADVAEKAARETETRRQTAENASRAAGEEVRNAERKARESRGLSDQAREKARQAESRLKEAETALETTRFTLETTLQVLERDRPLVPRARASIASAEAIVVGRKAAKKAAEDAAQASERPWRSVAFSPDGASLVAAGDDQALHVFEAERGRPAEVLEEGQGTVGQLLAAAGGKLVSLSAGTHANVYQPAGEWALARVIGRLDEPATIADRVLKVDFHPNGRWLAAAGGEPGRPGELKVWDVEDGRLARAFPDLHSDTIFGVQFSPDGEFLATASADRLVKVVSMADGKTVRTLAGHSQHARGVAWRADGKLLASCGADNTIKVWDPSDGTLLRTETGDANRIREYRREVTSISFIGVSDLILASSGDRTVRVHHAASAQFVRTCAGTYPFIYAAAATRDGKTIVAGGHDGVLRLWNGDNGNVIREFPPAGANGNP